MIEGDSDKKPHNGTPSTSEKVDAVDGPSGQPEHNPIGGHPAFYLASKQAPAVNRMISLFAVKPEPP